MNCKELLDCGCLRYIRFIVESLGLCIILISVFVSWRTYSTKKYYICSNSDTQSIHSYTHNFIRYCVIVSVFAEVHMSRSELKNLITSFPMPTAVQLAHCTYSVEYIVFRCKPSYTTVLLQTRQEKKKVAQRSIERDGMVFVHSNHWTS